MAVKQSLEYDAGLVRLKGDVDSPGANKTYGTDASGNRGWKNDVSGSETGDVRIRYATGEKEGWVRLNGRSIGNAASAATERANADTQALFIHLWNGGSLLVVSGGRGTTALADFNAGKRLNLPDAKGRAPVFMDGMGGTATNRVTNGGVLGSSGGEEKQPKRLTSW